MGYFPLMRKFLVEPDTSVSYVLDQEMWGEVLVAGYQAHWTQWNAGRHYRQALSQAQQRARSEGSPDG